MVRLLVGVNRTAGAAFGPSPPSRFVFVLVVIVW